MKSKYCYVQIETVTRKRGATWHSTETRMTSVPMLNSLLGELHDYGSYESFAAAEQLWAINVGLADEVVTHHERK